LIYLLGFYRIASIQGGLSQERNVCPSAHLSVYPSVKGADYEKTKKSMPKLLYPIIDPFI